MRHHPQSGRAHLLHGAHARGECSPELGSGYPSGNAPFSKHSRPDCGNVTCGGAIFGTRRWIRVPLRLDRPAHAEVCKFLSHEALMAGDLTVDAIRDKVRLRVQRQSVSRGNGNLRVHPRPPQESSQLHATHLEVWMLAILGQGFVEKSSLPLGKLSVLIFFDVVAVDVPRHPKACGKRCGVRCGLTPSACPPPAKWGHFFPRASKCTRCMRGWEM